jgi:hypothetical protein
MDQIRYFAITTSAPKTKVANSTPLARYIMLVQIKIKKTSRFGTTHKLNKELRTFLDTNTLKNS